MSSRTDRPSPVLVYRRTRGQTRAAGRTSSTPNQLPNQTRVAAGFERDLAERPSRTPPTDTSLGRSSPPPAFDFRAMVIEATTCCVCLQPQPRCMHCVHWHPVCEECYRHMEEVCDRGDEAVVRCPECRTEDWRDTGSSHLQVVVKRAGAPVFSCPWCKREGLSAGALEAHTPGCQARDVPCTLCLDYASPGHCRATYRRGRLLEHLLHSHSEEPKFDQLVRDVLARGPTTSDHPVYAYHRRFRFSLAGDALARFLRGGASNCQNFVVGRTVYELRVWFKRLTDEVVVLVRGDFEPQEERPEVSVAFLYPHDQGFKTYRVDHLTECHAFEDVLESRGVSARSAPHGSLHSLSECGKCLAITRKFFLSRCCDERSNAAEFVVNVSVTRPCAPGATDLQGRQPPQSTKRARTS